MDKCLFYNPAYPKPGDIKTHQDARDVAKDLLKKSFAFGLNEIGISLIIVSLKMKTLEAWKSWLILRWIKAETKYTAVPIILFVEVASEILNIKKSAVLKTIYNKKNKLLFNVNKKYINNVKETKVISKATSILYNNNSEFSINMVKTIYAVSKYGINFVDNDIKTVFRLKKKMLRAELSAYCAVALNESLAKSDNYSYNDEHDTNDPHGYHKDLNGEDCNRYYKNSHVRAERRSIGFSQRKLAMLFGCTREYLSKILKEQKMVRVRPNVIKIREFRSDNDKLGFCREDVNTPTSLKESNKRLHETNPAMSVNAKLEITKTLPNQYIMKTDFVELVERKHSGFYRLRQKHIKGILRTSKENPKINVRIDKKIQGNVIISYYNEKKLKVKERKLQEELDWFNETESNTSEEYLDRVKKLRKIEKKVVRQRAKATLTMMQVRAHLRSQNIDYAVQTSFSKLSDEYIKNCREAVTKLAHRCIGEKSISNQLDARDVGDDLNIIDEGSPLSIKEFNSRLVGAVTNYQKLVTLTHLKLAGNHNSRHFDIITTSANPDFWKTRTGRAPSRYTEPSEAMIRESIKIATINYEYHNNRSLSKDESEFVEQRIRDNCKYYVSYQKQSTINKRTRHYTAALHDYTDKVMKLEMLKKTKGFRKMYTDEKVSTSSIDRFMSPYERKKKIERDRTWNEDVIIESPEKKLERDRHNRKFFKELNDEYKERSKTMRYVESKVPHLSHWEPLDPSSGLEKIYV